MIDRLTGCVLALLCLLCAPECSGVAGVGMSRAVPWHDLLRAGFAGQPRLAWWTICCWQQHASVNSHAGNALECAEYAVVAGEFGDTCDRPLLGRHASRPQHPLAATVLRRLGEEKQHPSGQSVGVASASDSRLRPEGGSRRLERSAPRQLVGWAQNRYYGADSDVCYAPLIGAVPLARRNGTRRCRRNVPHGRMMPARAQAQEPLRAVPSLLNRGKEELQWGHGLLAVERALATAQRPPAKIGLAARGSVVRRDQRGISPVVAPCAACARSSLLRPERPAGLLVRSGLLCERLRGFRHHRTARSPETTR